MLPYDQTLFGGLLVLIYFFSLGLNRTSVQWLMRKVLPKTRLNVQSEIHLLQLFFSLAGSTIVFGYQASLATLVCAIAMWGLHRSMHGSNRLVQPLTWLGMFGWLSYIHLTRPDGWTINISGCVMLMTIRYTSFAGDRAKKLCEPSTLLEWLGWTFFIPSFFTGPTASLKEYRQWHDYVTLPVSDSTEPIVLVIVTGEHIDIEHARPSNRAFVRALWYAPFVIIGQMTFPVMGVTKFLPSDGMLYRVFYAWIAMWCIKARYYLAWGVAEAAFSASEASRFVWHRGRNIDVWQVEMARSVHAVTKYWNICTADWLKRYVYLPMRSLMDERGWRSVWAIVVTNVVSAGWHGIAPGYYATFISGGVCTAIGRLMHKHLDPRIDSIGSVALSHFYEVVMVLWTNVLVVTFGLPFQLLSWKATWEAWRGLFFIGHVWLGAALLLVLGSIVLSRPAKDDKTKTE
jgi:lysophospholipid acyltransferase